MVTVILESFPASAVEIGRECNDLKRELERLSNRSYGDVGERRMQRHSTSAVQCARKFQFRHFSLSLLSRPNAFNFGDSHSCAIRLRWSGSRCAGRGWCRVMRRV